MDQKDVYVIGYPEYRQGSHDGLCVYYSAAMMLGSIFPDSRPLFGEGDRVRKAGIVTRDPLFQHFEAREPTRGSGKGVCDWYFRGKELADVVPALNDAAASFGVKEAFSYHGKGAWSDKTFRRIRSAIDDGLPVILGWQSREYGNHCVLVEGYSVPSRRRWLMVNDPGAGRDAICWEDLNGRGTAQYVELVTPDGSRIPGPRLDKISVKRGPAGDIKEFAVRRKMPGGGGTWRWEDIKELRSRSKE
jgi:hypothetical protein